MGTFLEHYGLSIMIAIIIAMMILVATPVGNAVRGGLVTTFNHFGQKSVTAMQNEHW